jgi:hypothetical protein
VIVHPQKQDNTLLGSKKRHDLSLLFNKKKILKYFGSKNPFTNVTQTLPGSKNEVDFYGVVTFEVEIKRNIVGMEYSNMLIENSSRIVFEAKKIQKRSFEGLPEFFAYYSLDERNKEGVPYTPEFLRHHESTIHILKAYPF